MQIDRNPDHWKLFIFYYNPAEPRLWVPRYSWKFTLNYARPAAWLITALVIAAITAFAIHNNL